VTHISNYILAKTKRLKWNTPSHEHRSRFASSLRNVAIVGKGNKSQNQKPSTERRFINEAEPEILTGVSRRTWQKHRLFGRGPPFYRLCGSVRYDLQEVLVRPTPPAEGGGLTLLELDTHREAAP